MGDVRSAGVLPRDPAVPVRAGDQGTGRGRADQDRRGSWSRSRSATTSSRRASWRPRSTSTSTNRSSTGSTTSWGRWASGRSSTCGSRTRCSSRSGIATTSRASQITMAESFGVEDRGHFYDPVGALRDVVVNHLMQVVAAAAMEPPVVGRGRTAQGRARARCTGRCPRPIRRITCAASTTDTGRSTASPRTRRPRPTPRCGSRSTTGAGRASRSSSAPASACRSRRPSCASSSDGRRGSGSRGLVAACPSRASWSSSSIPTTGIRLLVDAQRHEAVEPEQISLDMEFAQEGGEGPTPYEVLLHAAMVGDSKRFTRQDGVEQCWRVMAAAARAIRRRCTRTPRDHGGPEAADQVLAGYGRWHGPWVAS